MITKTTTESPLTNAEYHALDSVSNTKLKTFRESRKLYHARHVAKTLAFKQTPAMQLGSIVHAMTFEPENITQLYAVPPKCDRRTNVGKAIWNEFLESAPEGCEVVDADTWQQAHDIHSALIASPIMRSFMDAFGKCEEPLFWTDPATGLECRSKIDKLCRELDVIIDLKVVMDSTPSGFARAVVGFEYDCQAAWYMDGYKANFGEVPNFVFVAVSKTAPYEIGFYELNEDDLAAARVTNSQTLASLKACMETGDWKSQHETSVVSLKLPRYAQYRSDYTQFSESNDQ